MPCRIVSFSIPSGITAVMMQGEKSEKLTAPPSVTIALSSMTSETRARGRKRRYVENKTLDTKKV